MLQGNSEWAKNKNGKGGKTNGDDGAEEEAPWWAEEAGLGDGDGISSDSEDGISSESSVVGLLGDEGGISSDSLSDSDSGVSGVGLGGRNQMGGELENSKKNKEAKSDKCLHSHYHSGCESQPNLLLGEGDGEAKGKRYKGDKSDKCLHSHYHSGCESQPNLPEGDNELGDGDDVTDSDSVESSISEDEPVIPNNENDIDALIIDDVANEIGGDTIAPPIDNDYEVDENDEEVVEEEEGDDEVIIEDEVIEDEVIEDEVIDDAQCDAMIAEYTDLLVNGNIQM